MTNNAADRLFFNIEGIGKQDGGLVTLIWDMKEENSKHTSITPSVQERYPSDNDASTSYVSSRLVLFDFDGTITTKDTLIEFVRFYRGRKQFLFGMLMLSPILALLILKIIPNWKAKQYFLARFFKGEKATDFNARCNQFSATVLPGLIRREAQNAILLYRKQKATIAVVTASAENWVKPWCDQLGLICLATQLEAMDGIITGKLSGRNCYGDEKVCRIKDHFNLEQYEEIIAYGDSRGDLEMLALAHKKYYKPFRSTEANP